MRCYILMTELLLVYLRMLLSSVDYGALGSFRRPDGSYLLERKVKERLYEMSKLNIIRS